MRIRSDDAVAVVIDVQEKLLPWMNGRDELLDRCRVLLHGLRILEVPIRVTEQYVRGLGPTAPAIRECLDEFEPIEKTCFSCADSGPFLAALRASGRRSVILCGIEAHVCVLQTAIDLQGIGFQVVVAADCVASRRAVDRDVAVMRVRQEGGIVTSCESLLFELCRVAATDRFRAISRLVK